MDERKIEEGLHRENLQLSSINKRVVAYVIDEIIISVLFSFIVWDKLKVITNPEEMMAYSSSLFLYIMSVKVLYQTIFVYMYGATLGKMAMKIEVIDSVYFSRPTFKDALLRSIMRVVSEMLFYFGYVVAFFSPLRLTWQDRVASTIVVDA